MQPVRVAVEVHVQQQLGRVRERHRYGGLRAARRVQGVRRHFGDRQGRRDGRHDAVPADAGGGHDAGVRGHDDGIRGHDDGVRGHDNGGRCRDDGG